MHELVVHILLVRRVLLCAEPPKPKLVEPRFQRSIAGNQNVHPQVELLTADEQRVLHIARDNVTLPALTILKGQLTLVGPTLELVKLVHQEDTLALGA